MIMTSSCWSDKGKNIPDVSAIPARVNIEHFDQDLFTIDTTQIGVGVERLRTKYPVFMKDIYLPEILPALQDPSIFAAFVKAPQIRQLYDTCQLVFGDFSDLSAEFAQAMQFYQYYFPQRKVPKVVTYISEYSLGNFTFENILGVGLDFFLGANHASYDPQFFPAYIRRTMNKSHLVAKSIEALATGMVGDPQKNQLLDIMVTNGKVLFIMDHLLPYAPDSIKLGYTSAQTQWCVDNELQIWSHLVGEELLYSTRMRDIRKLVDHSPNVPGMPNEAPGRVANWIGWQIVKSYVKQHPKMTFEDLLLLKDSQDLLNRSKYKPKLQ
ncbi:MAG: hypothetical protein AAF985_18850 [Bacteroidota bacterium]